MIREGQYFIPLGSLVNVLDVPALLAGGQAPLTEVPLGLLGSSTRVQVSVPKGSNPLGVRLERGQGVAGSDGGRGRRGASLVELTDTSGGEQLRTSKQKTVGGRSVTNVFTTTRTIAT